MSRVRAFLLGVALAITGVATAVQTVGIPSFLRIQALGLNTAAPAAGNLAIAGSMTAGSVPDARLTANVVKYTDSGTNFTGATKPTVGGNAICTVVGGVNCPWLVSFELTSAGGAGAPSINFCNHCSSPSVVRSGTGVWNLTMGISQTGNAVAICTPRGSVPTNWGTITAFGDMSGGAGTALVRFVTVAGGALTDPTGTTTIACVAGT